jgi:hypothetical protein
MKEFTFDVKLFATFSIKAANESAARRTLKSCLDCASVNAGSLPDGSPLVGEASLDDDPPDLISVDGESV